MYTKKQWCGSIADDVLYRLRRIADSLKVPDVRTSVKDFQEWEMYKGKTKNWFESNTYYDALLIFCHFDHLRRLMFTKCLNHETFIFLTAKRPFLPMARFIFFPSWHSNVDNVLTRSLLTTLWHGRKWELCRRRFPTL